MKKGDLVTCKYETWVVGIILDVADTHTVSGREKMLLVHWTDTGMCNWFYPESLWTVE